MKNARPANSHRETAAKGEKNFEKQTYLTYLVPGASWQNGFTVARVQPRLPEWTIAVHPVQSNCATVNTISKVCGSVLFTEAI